MDFLLQATPMAAVAVWGFVLLGILGCVVITSMILSRALPSVVLKRLNEAEIQLAAVLAEIQNLRGEWSGVLENLETVETAIERKRRQAQTTLNKLETKSALATPSARPNGEPAMDDLVGWRDRLSGR